MNTVDGTRSQMCQVVPSHIVDAELPQKLVIQVDNDIVSGDVHKNKLKKAS